MWHSNICRGPGTLLNYVEFLHCSSLFIVNGRCWTAQHPFQPPDYYFICAEHTTQTVLSLLQLTLNLNNAEPKGMISPCEIYMESMWLCVYMQICKYAYMYICIYVYMYICMYINICLCIYANICIICIYKYTYVYVYIYTYVYVYVIYDVDIVGFPWWLEDSSAFLWLTELCPKLSTWVNLSHPESPSIVARWTFQGNWLASSHRWDETYQTWLCLKIGYPKHPKTKENDHFPHSK